jgi:hypothetical protein
MRSNDGVGCDLAIEVGKSLCAVGDCLDSNRTAQASWIKLKQQQVAHASVESVGNELHLVREGKVDKALVVQALSERRDAVAPVIKRPLPVSPKRDVEKMCDGVTMPKQRGEHCRSHERLVTSEAETGEFWLPL